MKSKKTEYGMQNTECRTQNGQLQPEESQKGIEILTGAVLFIFGAYQSILYFGHTIVPISDFPAFFQVGSDILHLRMPGGFKLAPVLGILQNLLVPVSWGQSPELTAGWLLNAIVHPFTIVLLWLVGRRIIGKSAAWVAIIAAVNPWLVYMLTEPIVETTYLFFILLTIYLIFRRSRWAYLLASITTMVRYEGAALILAAFVVDVIHRKDRRDAVKAIAFSLLASLPLAIWLALTVVNWQAGTTHYFEVLFSKDYSKVFGEPKSDRTGLGLHWQILWRTGFQPLLLPYMGASSDFAEMLFKLSQMVCITGFLLGCIWAGLKRRWEVLVLLLFFVPYFILHSYYPYPLARFHSTIFWIVLLVVWFGLQSAGGALARKAQFGQRAVLAFQVVIIAAAGVWFILLACHLGVAASASPTSATIPYVAMVVVLIIIVMRMSAVKWRFLPRNLCIAALMCLMITSNQFLLANLLGDGKREIEFKQLGEWFSANASPGEKLAVYNNITQVFAGKNAANVVGYPRADGPEELTSKLRDEHITYVVWATREGVGNRHNDYRFVGLDKNIAFLAKPQDIGPYKFVTQVGNNNGFVNIFRLTGANQNQPGGDK
jgi:hypothetical protein